MKKVLYPWAQGKNYPVLTTEVKVLLVPNNRMCIFSYFFDQMVDIEVWLQH